MLTRRFCHLLTNAIGVTFYFFSCCEFLCCCYQNMQAIFFQRCYFSCNTCQQNSAILPDILPLPPETSTLHSFYTNDQILQQSLAKNSLLIHTEPVRFPYPNW